MDSTFNDGLRIVLQWMELRRQRWERQLLQWQKELYMMRRTWYGRDYKNNYDTWQWRYTGGELPGGPIEVSGRTTVKEQLAHYRYYLRMNGGPLAPGY